MVNRKRLLYIESRVALRIAVTSALEGEGYQVLAYSHAEAAGAHLLASDVDIALIADQLPGMSGGHFAAVLRKTHPPIRIFLLTGGSNVPELKRLVPGAVVLVTPLDLEALLIMLRSPRLGSWDDDLDGPPPFPFPKTA